MAKPAVLHDPAQLAALSYLNGYTGNTRRTYHIDVEAWFAWCRDQGIDPMTVKRAHIEAFGQWLSESKGLMPSSVSRRLSTVCGFYKAAVIEGYLEIDPARYVRRPQVPRESQTLGLSFLEFASFLQAAEQLGPVPHALAATLGLLGLRVSEACGVQLGDFGEERGHRVLRVVGKGSKHAVIPLPVPVVRATDRAAEGRTEGPLLRTRSGAQMDRSAACRMVTKIAREADLTHHVHPHMLRHAFVTQLLDAGASLRDVQIAARHADPRMTMRYDRARANLDRHANYILAARMSS